MLQASSSCRLSLAWRHLADEAVQRAAPVVHHVAVAEDAHTALVLVQLAVGPLAVGRGVAVVPVGRDRVVEGRGVQPDPVLESRHQAPDGVRSTKKLFTFQS